MSLKAKLVSTIAAICMVICLLSVGIWAATSGTVNISGSVSFTVTDVNVLIEGEVEGMDGVAPTLADVDFDATDKEGEAIAAWDLGALKFVKDEATGKLNDIVLTITITNRSAANDVVATLTVTAPTAGDVSVVASEAVTITKGGTNSDTITMTISTDLTGNDTVSSTAFAANLSVANV